MAEPGSRAQVSVPMGSTRLEILTACPVQGRGQVWGRLPSLGSLGSSAFLLQDSILGEVPVDWEGWTAYRGQHPRHASCFVENRSEPGSACGPHVLSVRPLFGPGSRRMHRCPVGSCDLAFCLPQAQLAGPPTLPREAICLGRCCRETRGRAKSLCFLLPRDAQPKSEHAGGLHPSQREQRQVCLIFRGRNGDLRSRQYQF